LYYAQGPGRLAFASELQALRPLPGLDASVDEDALFAYFRYLCVPAPATIVKGVRKLAPGCILRWDPDGATIWRYWDPREVARKGFEEPYSGSFGEAADELESRLKEAIKMRMLSDVPLGAFISGGVDSSTVVALMQAQSTERIKTYTIGFPEATHDESIHAGAVATHLGTDHHTLMLSPGDVLHLVPEIGKYYDEPFADSSNVPTYLLSRFARQDVTVALSGDGGDELFAGYPRYFWGARIEGIRKALSPTGAKYLGRALAGVPAGLWDGPAMRLGGARLAGSEGLSTRVQRLGGYLACSPDRVYEEMLSAWREPGRLIGPRAPSGIGPNLLEVGDLPWPERMMAVDLYNYLVDDILTKVDRASMAVSLEARVPLLDHRFVEWSWRIPRAFKMAPQGDRGKLLLREVLYRHVPRDLIERPKKGFGMPLGPWLRKELKSWALEKLAPEGLEAAGLCPAPVIEAWEAHQRGENRIQQLWTVLTYVQWLERWRDHRAG
ncbi:MAG: asparagine synthase (glutamine-hydrolyzing), partial [Candidatus Sericytochromatia bacterium]|nr:asparagine synthase (glutamine-hydrolyzing) [Candidatus Tanganyikabacteria bacterium]